MEKIKQLKSVLSRKEEVYVLKEDKENVLDSLQRVNNADQKQKKKPRKSMRVTTSQSLTSGKNNAHFLSHNLPVYPLEKKFIGTSSILARRKCRLLPTETVGMSLL